MRRVRRPARAVIIAGFSRGAIACNYIGLDNDEIAKLWLAFIPYSHCAGVVTNWLYPGADRACALLRLKWLDGRPVFISQEKSVESTRAHIGERAVSLSQICATSSL